MNLEERNKDGDTPILFAVRKNVSHKICSILLDYGARIDACDSNGDTPLLLCCKLGNTSREGLISLFLENGADIEARNKKGNTPLMEASINEQINILYNLLELGANVESRNNNYLTSLLICSDKNLIKSAQVLLKKNADPNMTDERGMTSLMFASFRGNLAIVQMLIDSGANVEDELWESVVIEQYEIADKFSYEHFFNDGKKNVREVFISPGSTALTFAELFGGLGVQKILLEAGAKKNPELEQDLEELRQSIKFL